jgi:hypothetical protein
VIIPTAPILQDPKDTAEVRKSLLNIAAQLNAELEALRAQIAALTP